MGIMDQISELPGETLDFAKSVPSRLGRLPGRMMRGMANYAGTVDSGLPKEMELTGINPRRQYWANSLSDLSNIIGQRGDPNTRSAGLAAQTKHQQDMVKDRWMRQYQAKIAQAAILNAGKRPDGRTQAMKNAEAMGFKPGSVEYTEMVKKLSMKPGVAINMGNEVTTDFYGNIAKELPTQRVAAQDAQDDIAKYKAMEAMLPHLGTTGGGKAFTTTLRGTLNQFGMEGVGNALDLVSESFGIDLFSGDQGAIEAFNALSNADVVASADELYPVSNKDMSILRDMVAGLSISDPDAQRLLINRGVQRSQPAIDAFNRSRTYMQNMPGYGTPEGFPAIPPLRKNPFIDVKGVLGEDDEFEQEMIRLMGPDWREKF